MNVKVGRTLIVFSLFFCYPADTSTVSCGVPQTYGLTPAIYRGRDVDSSYPWPWLAAIFVTSDIGVEFSCGGTIVSNNVVLTAAHCLYEEYEGKKYALLDPTNIYVSLGRFDLLTWGDLDVSQFRTVLQVKIHPHYDRKNFHTGNDLAALVLLTPVSWTWNVQPVCLLDDGTSKLEVNALGTVVGWGQNEEMIYQRTPKYIQMPIAAQANCEATVGHSIVSTNQFCAGFRNGSGTCFGDSGGGMYVISRNKWILQGIVSLSFTKDKHTETNDPFNKICDTEKYAIFTDMTMLTSWVKHIVGISAIGSVSTPGIPTFEPQPCSPNQLKGTSKILDHFYYLSKFPRSWSSAREYCLEHGMALVSIESQREQRALETYIKKQLRTSGNKFIWTSGTDEEQEGEWVWEAVSKAFTYQFTFKPKLKNGHEYNCMALHNCNHKFHWHDLRCTSRRIFMCENNHPCI